MNRQKGVLILAWKDVEELLDMAEVIQSVETAFKEKGNRKVQMPPKIYLNFDSYDGDLRAMPAYLSSLGIAGVKIVNSHSKNRSIGLPTVMALIELVEPKNGRPLALLDGTMITSFRTGAASAVATKYLARKDSRVLGIIGAGVQSQTQINAISKIINIEEVNVFDADKKASERLTKFVADKGISSKVLIKDNAKEAVIKADIVITVTPSRAPIVFADWLKEGVHINAIGADAPGKQELDPEILRKGKIVVDDVEQTVHSGEINYPISKGILTKEDIYAELGDIIVGNKEGRTSDSEITVFDSTGLAILDVAVGNMIYQKAIKENRGTAIDILDL